MCVEAESTWASTKPKVDLPRLRTRLYNRASHLPRSALTDSALQRPHLLGGASDRADVRYNAACAAALAGQAAAAAALLQGLAAAKVLDAADVAADEDLVGLRGEAWFVQLLQQLQLQLQPGQ